MSRNGRADTVLKIWKILLRNLNKPFPCSDHIRMINKYYNDGNPANEVAEIQDRERKKKIKKNEVSLSLHYAINSVLFFIFHSLNTVELSMESKMISTCIPEHIQNAFNISIQKSVPEYAYYMVWSSIV